MRSLAKDPAERWPALQDTISSFAAGLVPGDDSPRTQLAEFVRAVSPVRTDGIALTPASPIPRGRGATPPPAWTSIQIAPAQAELEVGGEVELGVAFLPTPAPNVETPTPVWTSSAPSIVSVSPSGIATALAPGSAVVTAQAGNLAASTVVAVLRVPVASMQLNAPERALEVGVSRS